MAGEWKRTSLREAGVTLIDCDHRTPPGADIGYPYIAIPQLKEGRLSLDDVRRISPEHFAEWTRKAKPQHHDVILSRRCNPGETAYVPAGVECALGQNLVLLRSDGNRLFPPFLRWLVRGTDWWEQVGTFINVGAVFDSLRCADIPNFSLPLPRLAEQKAIASILGALDDKIELNRRMNATLESMARALFKSWFVDFDPVRAKLDGRAPLGMDAATAALFPSSFERSEGGLRPRGWIPTRLGDHVDLVRGNTYKSALKDLPGPFLLGLGSIHRNGGFRDDSLRTYGGASSPKILLRPGDLFASLKDVTQAADLLGAVARVPSEIDAGRLTQDTVKLIPRGTGIPVSYLYWTLRLPEYREYCRGRATGTTNLGLSRDDFLGYPVLVPTAAVLERFNAIESSVDLQMAVNRQQSRTLATLRDTLLPKLLSGELSVDGFAKEASL